MEMLKDKVKQRAASKRWAELHPERIKDIKRRSREKYRERNTAYRREYRRLNADKVKALKLKWEKENPDRVTAMKALRRLRQRTLALASDLRCRYNLTIDEYLSLLAAQAGRCAICGVTQGSSRGSRLHLDHDHQTGTVRGLLCIRCNPGLGYFLDDPKLMRRAAAYVERWNANKNRGGDASVQPVLALIPEAKSKTRSDQSVAAIAAIG